MRWMQRLIIIVIIIAVITIIVVIIIVIQIIIIIIIRIIIVIIWGYDLSFAVQEPRLFGTGRRASEVRFCLEKKP